MSNPEQADTGLNADALQIAICLEPRPDLKQIETLLRNGHDPTGGRDTSPLYSAIGRNQKQVVELLIKFGARLDIRTKQGTTVLHEAVKRRNRHIVRTLISKGADLEAVVQGDLYDGCTSVHLAVVNQDHKMVNLLLSIGASSTVASKHGWTPLDFALLDHQADIAKLIINHTTSVVDRVKEFRLDSISPSATPEEARDLALHILDNGFSKATRKHGEIYLICLNKASHKIKTEEEHKVVRGLINGVQECLMDLAGRSNHFPRYRTLCEWCEKFQSRGSQTIFNRVRHSEGIEALRSSAQRGCELCCILCSALDRGHAGISFNGGKYLHGNPAVMLRIMENADKRLSLDIECGDTCGSVDLHYLPVCSTPPTDKMSFNSERTFAIVRALLDHCETDPSHSLCQRSIPELPTRVIDVGSESQHPRLVCSNKTKSRYITLSYCWGKGKTYNMKTVQANLDAHLQSIYFDDFPKTIQDAITITRQLGIKYLWVDALCIIQDLREDFIREVALMTDIYANSTLTISAEDATDCSKGIFKDRNWSSTAILPLGLRLPSNNGEKRRTPKCASVSAIPKLVSHSEHERRTHLATRGWTLQEYALSSRMLCYSSADLKWRCSKEVWSQSLQSIRDPTWRNLKTNLSRKPGFGRDTMEAHWVFQTWTSLISDYTSRELTDPRDSLFAVAGLQGRIADIIEDVPSIGPEY
ncbi:heterokaryon incompatibility protein [Rutstroemia sp. NJR-2017a WRK4]|nr:heterokaryon incompatibility protein [Rutstroemia sp. NJR-2017a WRK4]